MSAPQVCVLSNPNSTGNLARFDQLRRILENTSHALHYELSSVDDIPEALRMFAKTNPVMLIINGGDGTVQATLSSIVNDKPFDQVPPVAVLASGKTNMIAADLGAGGRPTRVLKKLLALAANGKLPARQTQRYLIEMDMGDGHPPRYGMFFGGGGIVGGIRYCRARIYPLNLPNFLSHILTIILLSGSAITGARKKGAALYTESMKIVMPSGGIVEGRFFAVVATTLDRLVLGMRPYAREGRGKLKFSAIDMRATSILNAMRGILMGSFGRKSLAGINVRRVNEIRITGNNPVTLDGELYEVPVGQTVILKGNYVLDFISLRRKP
ncbi:MAG: diacylglycerol kinase [Proteobacteria bacterium]|nr:diacylglycerol kinase [Pseudomonadota bacterium]